MKILMIYPEFPDTFWSFKHALKFIRKKASTPPLGLLTVAAMLPEEWEKRVVDLNVRTLKDNDIEWADYAFVSAMVVQRQSTNEVIARCKAAGLKVVAGGPLFTAEFDQFPDVDHFVLNEAEMTLKPFLRDLEQGTGAAHLYLGGIPGHLADTRADVGTGRPEPLRDHVDPVFTRLPVRLRVLQHHLAVRAHTQG